MARIDNLTNFLTDVATAIKGKFNLATISPADFDTKINQLTNTNDATATSLDLVSGKTAFSKGEKIIGSLVVQHYYTGSSAPTSSLGQDGDIYLQQ